VRDAGSLQKMMGRHKTVVAHQIVYRVLLLACLFAAFLYGPSNQIRLLRFSAAAARVAARCGAPGLCPTNSLLPARTRTA